MLDFLKLLLCLILVHVSSGSTNEVMEDVQKLGVTTLDNLSSNDTTIKNDLTNFRNNTKKIYLESAANSVISSSNGLLKNITLPSNQRPPSINKKGFFPIFGDKPSISIECFNKLWPLEWMRPFQEKIQKIAEFFTHPNHPGMGNIYTFLEKLHERGHQLFTGSKVSIYGTRPTTNYDFPFAYRNYKD